MAKRFRVALTFPGEHRDRVEKIAEALAGALGRERVLYDKWHDAEFARPNLDRYLADLYRHQSELIVVFLCKEYDEKDWTNLESRVWRELQLAGKDEMVMYLRLDKAAVRGVSTIDGYLPIRDIADAEVAANVLKRLGESSATPIVAPSSIQKLPTADPHVFGRDAQLDWLERAWSNPQTNFLQIVAPGGAGKTALMTSWYRRHLDAVTIFGWSFYSQGTREKSQTSSDPFFAEALRWFGVEVAATESIFTKVDLLVARLRRERVLLILDGVEPLQDPEGGLRDLPLQALLKDLAASNPGMVLATTRVKLSDVPDDEPRALSLDLENLDPADGARYLAHLGVCGPEDELRAASAEYWNHALALTLLGTYLVDFCNADIRRRIEIPTLVDPDSHAHRVIAAYARMFAGKPELDILRALGYFDRPAEPEALKLVLPKRHLDQAVEFLRRAQRLDHLPRALLARGTDRDLEEVFRIATRSGMRLFLADYHLAKGNIAEAERLIIETGYHRRDPDLAKLKAQKANPAHCAADSRD